MVIGTDCTGSCKSNYHAIMAMTAAVKTTDSNERGMPESDQRLEMYGRLCRDEKVSRL